MKLGHHGSAKEFPGDLAALIGLTRTEWSVGPLLDVYQHGLDATRRAIYGRKLSFGLPDWQTASSTIASLFPELGDSRHPLRQPHHHWGITLHEPQVTKGWAHFLSPEVHGRTEAERRVRCMLGALYRASGMQRSPAIGVRKGSLSVACEFEVSGGQRIDLLIRWQTPEGKHDGFVVEFKFGHHITTSQLATYRRYLVRSVGLKKAKPEKRGAIDETRRLFVVGVELRASDIRSLRRNPDWLFATWWDFMRCFDREYLGLTAADDSDDLFAAFRRVVWGQAKGYST